MTVAMNDIENLMFAGKTVIILDFDGVIANSVKECFLVAWWTYHGVEEITPEMFDQKHEKYEVIFNKFRYLVGPVNDYYFFLNAICEYVKISKTSLPDLFNKYSLECKRESLTFTTNFFRLRDIARNKFKKQWLALNPLYPEILEFLRRRLKKRTIFISSTKDKNSIECILKENQLEIPREHILGKEQGVDKRVHVQKILRKAESCATEAVFIDDNLLHLARVRSLGVQLFFASWGYCGSHGEADALKLGAKILNITQLK